MGDVKGFLKVKRELQKFRPVCERIKDYSEVNASCKEEHSKDQASRCMDCGTPFCHWGCPIGNYMPEWNDHLFRGHWGKAFELLDATNNLPEITGRICPAPCEYACVLGINDDPVTIKEDELAIIEYAFKNGLVKSNRPRKRTGKNVAVIGSGPAGWSCADQLNQAGHSVVVFERDDKIGGIMRYGIPDFKLDKNILDRRIVILKKEGIEFRIGANAGIDIPVAKLKEDFDAICIACGSRAARDLNIEGRQLKGIYFAMEYLVCSNRRVAGERVQTDKIIDAKGKKVVVIGGGDTGADCVGTAHRQGASCVVQIELLSRPPECRTQDYPWPKYPLLLKTSTSHEEGGAREWSVLTKEFIGKNGSVSGLSCVRVDFSAEGQKGCPVMQEVAGSGFKIEADLVILALGFLHPERKGIIDEFKLKLDSRGNVATGVDFMTSVPGIFAAGDMRRGQSLIVWAIAEGRRTAHFIDKYLMTDTVLPAF